MYLEWSTEIFYQQGGTLKYPKHEGVYVIALKINGKKKAKYVGQGNIYERMNVHESKNEPNDCLKKVMGDRDNVFAYYALVPHQQDRDNAERSLVDYFGLPTLCNEQLPMGDIVNINPPKFLQEISFD